MARYIKNNLNLSDITYMSELIPSAASGFLRNPRSVLLTGSWQLITAKIYSKFSCNCQD